MQQQNDAFEVGHVACSAEAEDSILLPGMLDEAPAEVAVVLAHAFENVLSVMP